MSFLVNKKSYSFFITITAVVGFFMISEVYAETVSGNGYILNQIISPISGDVSGNGYGVQQSGQIQGDSISGNGYKTQGVFGASVVPTVPAPIVNVNVVSVGGGTGGGWGYYVLPVSSTTLTTVTGTTTDGVAVVSPSVNSNTILTTNGSTCPTRIALSSPIDVKLKNEPEDVKKLEIFLNTYEGEKLKVDGIYGKADIEAVKRWQLKYKVNVLAPMKLKNPTGTIYTSSMRQIERQTTEVCGQQVIVHACPFFKTYSWYGSSGAEVKKIQQFLNIVRGEKLPINGKYGSATRDAVKRFQRTYRKDIVSIVTFSFISGNWNVSTRTKANEFIGCDKLK